MSARSELEETAGDDATLAAAWRPPTLAAADDRRVVTFYSHRPGSGRTLALVNVAAELARGRALGPHADSVLGVLCVDFDFDNPSLDTYLPPPPGTPATGGILQLILDCSTAAEGQEEGAHKVWEAFLREPNPYWYRSPDAPGVAVLPTGTVSSAERAHAAQLLGKMLADAASMDAASMDAASMDAASMDAASMDAASMDAASMDAASMDAASMDAASMDAASMDAASMDAASMDAASMDAASMDAASAPRRPVGEEQATRAGPARLRDQVPFFRNLRAVFRRHFAYVLVDACPGLTDETFASTALVADTVVAMFRHERAHLGETRRVLAQFLYEIGRRADDNDVPVLAVLSPRPAQATTGLAPLRAAAIETAFVWLDPQVTAGSVPNPYTTARRIIEVPFDAALQADPRVVIPSYPRSSIPDAGAPLTIAYRTIARLIRRGNASRDVEGARAREVQLQRAGHPREALYYAIRAVALEPSQHRHWRRLRRYSRLLAADALQRLHAWHVCEEVEEVERGVRPTRVDGAVHALLTQASVAAQLAAAPGTDTTLRAGARLDAIPRDVIPSAASFRLVLPTACVLTARAWEKAAKARSPLALRAVLRALASGTRTTADGASSGRTGDADRDVPSPVTAAAALVLHAASQRSRPGMVRAIETLERCWQAAGTRERTATASRAVTALSVDRIRLEPVGSVRARLIATRAIDHIAVGDVANGLAALRTGAAIDDALEDVRWAYADLVARTASDGAVKRVAGKRGSLSWLREYCARLHEAAGALPLDGAGSEPAVVVTHGDSAVGHLQLGMRRAYRDIGHGAYNAAGEELDRVARLRQAGRRWAELQWLRDMLAWLKSEEAPAGVTTLAPPPLLLPDVDHLLADPGVLFHFAVSPSALARLASRRVRGSPLRQLGLSLLGACNADAAPEVLGTVQRTMQDHPRLVQFVRSEPSFALFRAIAATHERRTLGRARGARRSSYDPSTEAPGGLDVRTLQWALAELDALPIKPLDELPPALDFERQSAEQLHAEVARHAGALLRTRLDRQIVEAAVH